jgi:hypothetical protein
MLSDMLIGVTLSPISYTALRGKLNEEEGYGYFNSSGKTI